MYLNATLSGALAAQRVDELLRDAEQWRAGGAREDRVVSAGSREDLSPRLAPYAYSADAI